MHANSASDVPARLEALGLAAGLPRAALHALVAAGLDVVVHLGRDRAGRRRLESVDVLTRDGDGLVRGEPALAVDRRGGADGGPGLPLLADRIRRRGVDVPPSP